MLALTFVERKFDLFQLRPLSDPKPSLSKTATILAEVLEDPPVERRRNNCSQIFSTSTRPCEKPVPRCRCPVGLWAGRASSLLHQSFYVVIHLHVFNQLSSFYCLKSCRGLIPLLAPKVADQHHSAMSLDNLMTPAWLKLTMRYGRCHRTT